MLEAGQPLQDPGHLLLVDVSLGDYQGPQLGPDNVGQKGGGNVVTCQIQTGLHFQNILDSSIPLSADLTRCHKLWCG